MKDTVLLVTEEESLRDAVARRLVSHGLEVVCRRKPAEAIASIVEEAPSAIVINLEDDAANAIKLCRSLKASAATGTIPVLAISSMKEVTQIETILEQGADDHVSRPFPVSKLLAKIDRLLEMGARATECGKVSEIVAPVIDRIRRKSMPLGDSVEIFPGVVERPTLPAQLAHLASGRLIWRDILLDDAVQRFHVGSSVRRVRFDRLGLVQMPSPQSIDQPETVLVRRTAEPLVAAVDRGGHAVCARLFTLVPVLGLSCAYLASVINSRITDFWVSRVLKANPRHLGAFSQEDIRSIPLVIPSARQQRKVAKVHEELEALATQAARENTPQIQLKQAKALGNLNRLLFSLYGLGKDAQEQMASLSH